MLDVQNYLKTQKEAVNLMSTQGLTYEEAMRVATSAKEEEQRIKLREQVRLLEAIGSENLNTILV